jgi:hypothetical protein
VSVRQAGEPERVGFLVREPGRSLRMTARWLGPLILGIAGATGWGASPVPAEVGPAERTAVGTFEVSMAPAGAPDAEAGVTLQRLSLTKTFTGELTGTSRGEMLTARTPVDTSAGYVAMERFTGTLDGRAGSFVLQHDGVMHDGGQALAIRIVPESGTGGLRGIAGELLVEIRDGAHHYELAYRLEAIAGVP